MMEQTGWLDVKCYEKDYKKFKSNKNGDSNDVLKEYIFCGKRNINTNS